MRPRALNQRKWARPFRNPWIAAVSHEDLSADALLDEIESNSERTTSAKRGGGWESYPGAPKRDTSGEPLPHLWIISGIDKPDSEEGPTPSESAGEPDVCFWAPSG